MLGFRPSFRRDIAVALAEYEVTEDFSFPTGMGA